MKTKHEAIPQILSRSEARAVALGKNAACPDRTARTIPSHAARHKAERRWAKAALVCLMGRCVN